MLLQLGRRTKQESQAGSEQGVFMAVQMKEGKKLSLKGEVRVKTRKRAYTESTFSYLNWTSEEGRGHTSSDNVDKQLQWIRARPDWLLARG